MRDFVSGFAAVCAALSLSSAPNLRAAAGDLDTSLAGSGMLQIGFGGSDDQASAVALQADGKVIMAGTIAGQLVLTRFDTNNVLDETFGFSGVVHTSLSRYPQISAMRIQLDGKIVVAGAIYVNSNSENDFFLARFNPDGTPDTSFGDDGLASRDYSGNSEECTALIIQSDGKLVVGGISRTSYPTYGAFMALARFDTNGFLDLSFNGNGWIVPTNNSGAYCLAQQSDGKILVGGYMGTNQIFRFNPNGSPDTTFGVGGKVRIPSLNSVLALTIQPGDPFFLNPDMIVAASKGTVNAQGGIYVARITLGGGLDTGFNGTGVASLAIGSDVNISGLSVLFASRFVRKIVLSGDFSNAGNQDFWLARFNVNGTADTTFGNGGIVKTAVSPGRDEACGMVVQPGLRLLIAGTGGSDPYNHDFALARYNWNDGSLDTNFHGTGILLQNLGNLPAAAKCIAVQTDGKIVAGGFCGVGSYPAASLCRLNPDGTLDAAFGDYGRVITLVGEQSSEATAMAIQPDGKLVIAGNANDGYHDSVMLARYHPNGALDTSFGTNGTLITVTGTNGSTAVAVALQPDGKIIVGARVRAADTDFAVLRYLSNGALDSTWNGTGKAITGIGPGDDELGAVAVQADGKIVASGSSYFTGTIKFSIVRYNSNGSLDASFGTFGRVATQFGGGTIDVGLGMVLQPNAKIILGGYTTLFPPAYDPDVALARYNVNGSLDSTFDFDGKTLTPIGLGADYAVRLGLQTDGKIVAGCRTQMGTYDRFGVVRFLSNGSVDSGYGFGGVNFFDFGTDASETLNDMALDPNGRIVMVGEVGGVFGILRIQGDATLRLNSITRLGNGHMLLKGDGVPNGTHTLLKSPTLGTGTFSSLASVTANASGNWQYEDATSSDATRFYRLSYP